MSLTSSPRSARPPLARSPLSRPAQPVAARGAGWVSRLWQRLCAALRVTPEQWYARQLAQQTALDVGRRVVQLSGGRPILMTPQDPVISGHRPAQADLP